VETYNGIVKPVQLDERKAKVVMGNRKIGLNGQGLIDEINGNIVLTSLMSYQPEKIHCIWLAGVGFQYLPIEALSLGQSTRIVMLYSAIYGLLDG
jgi:hypothetical protein